MRAAYPNHLILKLRRDNYWHRMNLRNQIDWSSGRMEPMRRAHVTDLTGGNPSAPPPTVITQPVVSDAWCAGASGTGLIRTAPANSSPGNPAPAPAAG